MQQLDDVLLTCGGHLCKDLEMPYFTLLCLLARLTCSFPRKASAFDCGRVDAPVYNLVAASQSHTHTFLQHHGSMQRVPWLEELRVSIAPWSREVCLLSTI